MRTTWDEQNDGGTEGEVLEMEGGIREQRAEGEPREDKSVSEFLTMLLFICRFARSLQSI